MCAPSQPGLDRSNPNRRWRPARQCPYVIKLYPANAGRPITRKGYMRANHATCRGTRHSTCGQSDGYS